MFGVNLKGYTTNLKPLGPQRKNTRIQGPRLQFWNIRLGPDVQNGQKWPLLSPSFKLDDSAASFELEARKRAAAARALNWTTPELQDALSMGLLRGLELDETVISWRKEGHNEEMET
ncbi:hypothetical protein F2Q69_00024015 [Brassica cretica]|uniref:Uncharacterized protein n=1 Tax=Brassica cretica TaxID=69181 RepID=A0A8S9Q4Z2_BRACR|nr:hypothetical protein F2Q69_00024015 [Brassica cretica]